MRHEKMLRREQPKSCARRASSPPKTLFKEATKAIQQVVEPEPEPPNQVEDSSPSNLDEPTFPTVGPGGIDEDALRDFLLRSDQAFENFTPWVQHDSTSVLPQMIDMEISTGIADPFEKLSRRLEKST